MKLLDYFTLAMVTEKRIPRGLENFARDPDADIFAAEENGFVVICESEKVSKRLEDKYSMVAVGQHDRGFVKGAETKKELVNDYAKLLASERISFTSTSSNFAEELKEAIEKMYEDEQVKEL